MGLSHQASYAPASPHPFLPIPRIYPNSLNGCLQQLTYNLINIVLHFDSSMEFLFHRSQDMPRLAPLMNVLYGKQHDFPNKLLTKRYVIKHLKTSKRKFYGRYEDQVLMKFHGRYED